MSKRNAQEYTIWNSVTPVAVTSSTDATPIVITATAHGLVTGDTVAIYGHTTNIAANGIFKVTRLSANTYSLQDYVTGADIVGSGGGAGSGGVMIKSPKIIFAQDYRNVVIAFSTSGSFNGTVKIAGSLGKTLGDFTPPKDDTPNFGATLSDANPYQFLQIINLDTAAAVNGATGITSAGTDLFTQYEVNVNGIKYICPIVTAWTAGVITLKMQLFDNE